MTCSAKQWFQKSSAEQIEDQYVHRVYREISQHFAGTRQRSWPMVEAFLDGLERGSVVVDAGCGNGRCMDPALDLCMVGVDRCRRLLLCGKPELEMVVGDHQDMPVRDGSVDAVLSIAVVHHLACEERRVRAILEIERILVRGGRFLIMVWAFEQDRRHFDNPDSLVPWNTERTIFHRYYHLFREGELDRLVAGTLLGIEQSGYDRGNWYVRGTKG